MKANFNLLLSIILLQLLTSCSSMLPVNSYYERAATLQQGNTEFSGHYTRYSVSHFGRTEKTNTGFGFRAGHGITDRFDLKLRYERQNYTANYNGRLKSAHYFSIIPKIALEPQRVSLLLPFSQYYTINESYSSKYKKEYTAITPMLLYTGTARNNKIDVTGGLKADFVFGQEGQLFWGGLLGMGFSQNLNRWALRPEVGLSATASDETYWNFGLSFQVFLFK